MSLGQDNKVAYSLLAGVCALVLVGGSVLALMIWSAKETGKPGRRAATAPREPGRLLLIYGPAKEDSPAPSNGSLTPIPNSPGRGDEDEGAAEKEKAADPEADRVQEFVRKLEEPKKSKPPAPAEEKPAQPHRPPSAPAEEKKADRSGSLSPRPLSPEERMLEIIRAFIVRQLAHPDGFAIVDHTKPQRVKAANKKPAQLMRVVFHAQDGSGRAGTHDFLFVVQNDEVVEHAPTAVYVAAKKARQQAMLQVALLNEAVLQQQLRAEARAAGAGGGGGFGGGFSGPRGGFSRGPSAAAGRSGGGGCVLRSG